MGITLDQLRNHLPAARDYRFLNYAATAPLLKPSAEVMASIIKQNLEPMSKHFDQWLAIIESGRKTVAETIQASSEEIAFTANTSMGLSIIAASLDWQAGDRVVYPAEEFPSNRFVWENLKSKGVGPEPLIIESGQDLLDKLKTQNLNRVRLVSFSAVSYIDGRRTDVKEITDFCHAHNILVAVDGIQAIGAVHADVNNWNCDFLACGGQKWLLGPVGSGFLFIRKELLKKLFIPLVGWASSRHAGVFDVPRLEFVDGARRLEPGLPDVAAIAGLAKSLEILSLTGWGNVFQRIRDHNQILIKDLAAMGYRPLNSKNENQSGIVTINIDSDKEAEDLHQALEKERVIVTQSRRFNRRQLRIAAHATTSTEDIEVFLNVLRTSRKINKVSETLATFKEAKQSLSGKTKPGLAQRERHALITGASRGLGEAIAKGLARRGYNLTLLSRDKDKLTAVSQYLTQQYNIKTRCVILDLADRTAVEQWLLENQTQFDFEVIVNNAAIAEAGFYAESDLQRLRDMFEVNYFTPGLLTQKILPGMLEKGQGWILNIVTSGARCSLPLFSGYSSSKSALWSWSEALGRELLGKGITVTTFLPPHMESLTQRQLGRKALSYYKLQGNHTIVPANQVAEQALNALFSKKSIVMPLAIRLKLAFNILMPDQMTKQIQQNKIT